MRLYVPMWVRQNSLSPMQFAACEIIIIQFKYIYDK